VFLCISTVPALRSGPSFSYGSHTSWSPVDQAKLRYKWLAFGSQVYSGCGSAGTTYWGLLGANGDPHGWITRSIVDFGV
jgi:hypothetical protein